jgi:hypothetical protein
VGNRCAQDGHVQYAGQRYVVEVVALTLDEARILVTSHAVADTADLRGSSRGGRSHARAPAFDAAAAWTALTMFMYPVQRHRFPEIAHRTSSSDGASLSSISAAPTSIIPGVQNPH